MPKHPNIRDLIEDGRQDEALAVLSKGFQVVAAEGARSANAALEAATRLYDGDVLVTAWFMHRPHQWLGGQTPTQRAEESDEGLEFVLEMIGAIEAGVFI